MTDDIVQRLRKQGRWVVTRRYPLIPQLDEEEWRTDPLCAEAADEIERLRAAIDGIRWVLDGEHGTMRHTTFCRLDADECREIAELLAVYPPKENDR